MEKDSPRAGRSNVSTPEFATAIKIVVFAIGAVMLFLLARRTTEAWPLASEALRNLSLAAVCYSGGLILVYADIRRRFSSYGKIATYTVLAFGFGFHEEYSNSLHAAYLRTTAGQAEIAQQAAQDDAVAKAEATIAAEGAMKAAIEASGDTFLSCKMLIPEVIAFSKQKDGPEIFELKDVQQIRGNSSAGLLCWATAVSDRGDMHVEFEVQKTPQGRTLLQLKYQ